MNMVSYPPIHLCLAVTLCSSITLLCILEKGICREGINTPHRCPDNLQFSSLPSFIINFKKKCFSNECKKKLNKRKLYNY